MFLTILVFGRMSVAVNYFYCIYFYNIEFRNKIYMVNYHIKIAREVFGRYSWTIVILRRINRECANVNYRFLRR